jgi:sugar phosphate isomerase/epimerase
MSRWPCLLHSVSYSGSWGQAPLAPEAFIDKAAELGFAGVMLMAKRPHVSPLDWDTQARARLRARIESRRLEHVVLAGYTNFTADLEHGEVPHREIQIQYVAELARLTRDLGGRIVRVFTGYEHPGSPYLAQWNLVVSALKECARRAAEFEVILGVQNHHDLGVGYESFRDLIRHVNEPNCRALFDAWAPALQGDDLRRPAELLAPLMVHTTVADYQKRPRYRYEAPVVNYIASTPYAQAVPMGEGFIDYAAFFAGLRSGGFEGSIAYEMCSPLADGGELAVLDRYARRFLEYMSGVQSS